MQGPDLSAAMIAEIYSQSPALPAALLVVRGGGLASPWRITNHFGGLVSGGQAFDYLPFDLAGAGAGEEEAVSLARLTLPNWGEILDIARSATSQPLIDLYQVRPETPDLIELAVPACRLMRIEAGLESIEADLQAWSAGDEFAVCARYTAKRTPGLY